MGSHVSSYPFHLLISQLKACIHLAYKTRNFRLNTTDGQSLGAWHILYAAE